MRRIGLFLLSFLLLLCSCSGQVDEASYERLAEWHAGYAALMRAEVGFMMEAAFRDPDTGQSGVLYYISGEACYDAASQLAWQKFTATLLAATSNAEEYYADGIKRHVEDGSVYVIETSPEALFGAFPYHTVPLPAVSELKSLSEEESDGGMLYTLVSSVGQKQLVEDIWQLDLYALAGIAVPDREKEAYGDVTYTYSVSDGRIRTLFVSLTVSLYETAGYTPGYTPKEEDYRLDLTLRAQISLRAEGEAVEIPAYQEEQGEMS